MNYTIELKNGLKFSVISKYVLDGERYLYLASDTEDIKFIFAKYVDDQYIEPVEDEEILVRLLELLEKDMSEKSK